MLLLISRQIFSIRPFTVKVCSLLKWKTRDILILEKEPDLGWPLNATRTKQMSHFPRNGLESRLLCEGITKISSKQSPWNANLISIKFNHRCLESFWFQLTNPPSPSTYTNSLQNVLDFSPLSCHWWNNLSNHQTVYVNWHHFLNWNNSIIKNKHKYCF